ncbi:hypothetical protein ACA910_008779 [Epithemia clementina (nom. ined.)]
MGGTEGDDKICKCCPYGLSFAAPCVLSIIAISFTWSATWGCNYLALNSHYSGNVELSELHFGPWTVEKISIDNNEVVDECVTWDESYLPTDLFFDASFKFTRAISLIGALIALIFFIPLMIAGCMVLEPLCLKIMAPMFAFAGFCMILTLILMNTDICQDEDCDLIGGGVAAILAFLFWMFTACTVGTMRLTESDDGAAPAAAAAIVPGTTVEEKTTVNEDGTAVKVTTTTTTDEKGNKTVQEVREVVKPGEEDTPALPEESPEESNVEVPSEDKETEGNETGN